ncbi:MAG TPA: hypothetical protein VNZ61_06640 [Roseomonas sp.]|nr:hypothetical protein [Roseomonas sp.]
MLSFHDWDGLRLEPVGLPDPGPAAGWDGAPISTGPAIHRSRSVTLWPEDGPGSSADV